MGLKQMLLVAIGSFFVGRSSAQELVELRLVDSVSVSFDSGSALVRNASALTDRINNLNVPHARIQLIAYTDTIGNSAYNKNLASGRLLAVSKLIGSTRMKAVFIDSLNQNEKRSGPKLTDELFRRVDVLIYQVEPKIKLNVPINLRINFHSGSDRILPSSMKPIESLRMVLAIDSTLQIRLNGHVCCQSNPVLSLNRAEKVKAYLVNNGIDAKRITCKGFSNEVKLVPETSEENKRKNMRVEVIFFQ